MTERGHPVRRRSAAVTLAAVLVVAMQALGVTPAHATPGSWRAGEAGSGAPPLPASSTAVDGTRMPSSTWADLGPDDRWARAAIDHVAGVNDWMRDYPPSQDGTWRFKPDAYESRKYWARALVRAFAPDEEPDPSIRFPDLDADRPFYRWAAIAVQHGWMIRGPGGRFDPDAIVTTRGVNRSLVVVLGMGRTAAALDRLSTDDGYRFHTPVLFGVNLLAMRLGLRYNNKVDESQDVVPRERLLRKQAAWSLHRASTLSDSSVAYLTDQYAGMTLPRMGKARKAIVDWGVRYVGFPYIWAGEWGFDSPEPAAFGGQPGPGFDCSGITWWAMRADDDVYWDISPPRPYRGWPLPQRASAEMSRMTRHRLRFAELVPGDLMFYDGDRDGTVDHVDVYVGNGWSLDSSSSVGGVTLMWVRTGWYREHFVHGRRIMPKP
jgi:cell wall-associated NlpC family hydrolase